MKNKWDYFSAVDCREMGLTDGDNTSSKQCVKIYQEP